MEEHATYEYQARAWDDRPYDAILGSHFRPLYGTKGEHIKDYPLAEVWLQWKEDVQLTDLDCLTIILFTKRGYSGKEPWDKGLTDEAKETLSKWINFENINDLNYWINALAHGSKVCDIIDALYTTEYDHTASFNYVYSALVELFQELATTKWFERINIASDWTAYHYESYTLYQKWMRICERYLDTDQQFTQLFSLYAAITTLHEQQNRARGEALLSYLLYMQQIT